MHIEVPLVTPMGFPISTVGVWVSGGADSALMLYLLCKQIVDNKLPIKVQPCTVDYKRPYQNIGYNIAFKVKEILDCDDTILAPQVYNPVGDTVWTPDELKQQFKDINRVNFTNRHIQALYTGTTLNPPVAIQEQFQYGVLQDIESVRGRDVVKQINKYQVHEIDGETFEFIEIRPFLETDKQGIGNLYKQHNLMDNLFPLTRSCEDLNTVTGHCGVCWWCEERLWGFGTL